MGQRTRTPAIERFLDSIEVDADGCWLWQGARNPDNGYGYLRADGRKTYAHRFSYEFFVEPIPPGLTIDHLCCIRACANPDHLEAVTVRVNVLRGSGPPARKARQTHCKRGHEFTPENTYHQPSRGDRRCRACAKLYGNKLVPREDP